MSRILRRPLFRGGPASSDGVGITSGLNNPRQGYADGPDDQGVQPSIFQNIYDAVNPSSETVLNKLQSNQNQQQYLTPNSSIAQSIYDALNPSSETIIKRLQQRQEEQKAPIIKTQAYREEQKKISKDYEAKIAAEKAANERAALYNKQGEGEAAKIQTSPTLGEDIDTYTKLLMNNAGPDKDEYTRQKYLTLAKFGLNLLKPTPVGIKPSLATSLASAAEKPLEEYGNISMQQSKEDRALRQAAVQLGIQKHMPGNIAKGIQDLMAMNPNMTVEEATSIITTNKNSAAIAREKSNEITQKEKDISNMAQSDPALKKLLKLNPNFALDYAKIAVEQGLYPSELKGLADDYNVNALQPGAVYFKKDKQTGELLPHRFIKGKLYSIREPEFKQKGI